MLEEHWFVVWPGLMPLEFSSRDEIRQDLTQQEIEAAKVYRVATIASLRSFKKGGRPKLGPPKYEGGRRTPLIRRLRVVWGPEPPFRGGAVNHR